MKAKVRKERGITLIALVITIIVLLILAGVSLSLVVGQNGVLNKATESVSATKKGTAIEQVSLAWSACQTDYLENNNGNEKSTFFTKEKLNENLSQGEVVSVDFEKDANGSEVKYKLDNVTYTVIVSNDGVVKIAGEGGSDPVTPPEKATYTVSMSGTGVTFSNTAVTVEEGSVYNNNITANENYKIKTITATMGETEVSTVVESETTGKVSIENVTGNIVITVVTEEKTAGEIKANPSEYYGKKVTGYTSTNGISDWRIFYSDGSNVFLIATDYVENAKLPTSGCGMITNGTYSAYWDGAPTVASTTNVAKFSPVTSETIAWTGDYGTNKNGKCVSTLLDTSKWTSFVDSSKAEMAIGSPTLSMWVASWNAKYPSDKMYCNKSDEKGYYVGTSSSLSSYYIDHSSKVGYQVAEAENMYYPHKSYDEVGEEYCQGYWLASPSAHGAEDLMSVCYSGLVTDFNYYGFNLGVRPVVCLKTGIEMTKNADGTITVGNVN